MSRKTLYVVAVLGALTMVGCSSSSSNGSSRDGGAGACTWPKSLDDGGPGACSVGQAYLQCSLASGGGCGCIAAKNGTCGTGCTNCQNQCGSDQYAVACGGPPLPDGGAYQSPPAGRVGAMNALSR